MSSRLFAGIDPGIGGAVGLVREDGAFAAVHDMPTLPTTTGLSGSPPRKSTITSCPIRGMLTAPIPSPAHG